MHLSRDASEKEKKDARRYGGRDNDEEESCLVWLGSYRCLLCYALPTRSKYLYDMIRIQPGFMQACQIGPLWF